MNRRQVLLVLATAAPGVLRPSNAAGEAPPVEALVSACFVPGESCAARIVAAINAAGHDIRVQAYGFSSRSILHALAAAQQRGVDVQAVLDRTNETQHRSGASLLARAGAKVWIDDRPAIAHNKIIVIDARVVIGGSYNFTGAAETRNAENVTVMESPIVAAWFLRNWQSRQAVSRPFSDSVGADRS